MRKVFLIVFIATFALLFNKSGIAQLTHPSGYFVMHAYNSERSDGSYTKIYYDGNRREIVFGNSHATSPSASNLTNLYTGRINTYGTIGLKGYEGGVDSRNFRVRFFQTDNQYVGGAELSGIAHVDGYWTAMYAKQGNSRSAAYFDGKIGIGTPTPDMELTVKGSIHAEEVKIDLNIPAPDYVFQNDYNLKSIEEVETYIKENSHLPEIPSAKEFAKNGVMVSEMSMKLLQKVEELTLYVIDQNKENKQQQQIIEKQQQLIEVQNAKMEELLKRIEKLEKK